MRSHEPFCCSAIFEPPIRVCGLRLDSHFFLKKKEKVEAFSTIVIIIIIIILILVLISTFILILSSSSSCSTPMDWNKHISYTLQLRIVSIHPHISSKSEQVSQSPTIPVVVTIPNCWTLKTQRSSSQHAIPLHGKITNFVGLVRLNSLFFSRIKQE